MPYNFDEEDSGEFRDVPDEVNGRDAEPVRVPVVNPQPQQDQSHQNPVRRRAGPVQPPVVEEPQEYEETTQEEDDDAEEIATVLSDARLRLEQGRLYEMIMNHNMFQDVESDEKAIKNVQREIRKFAKERMEIMLGMRQEEEKVVATTLSLENFPFNAVEIEVLKALADTATKGASREAEPYDAPVVAKPKPKLSPISSKPARAPAKPSKPLSKSPSAPVKRARPPQNDEVQQILAEEGVTMDEINEVFDPNYKPLTKRELFEMSEAELKERNRQARARVTTQVKPANMRPYPTLDEINRQNESRAAAAEANPQMQLIMSVLQKQTKQ